MDGYTPQVPQRREYAPRPSMFPQRKLRIALRNGSWVTVVERFATEAERVEMRRVAAWLQLGAVFHAIVLYIHLGFVLLLFVGYAFWIPGILAKVFATLCVLAGWVLVLALIKVPNFRRIQALRRDIARGTITCCVGTSKAPVRRWYSSDDVLWEVLPGSGVCWWKGG